MKVPKLTDQQIKVLLISIGVAVALFIVYKVLKSFGFFGATGKDEKPEDAINSIVVSKSNLSFTENELHLKTEQLYSAMDQFGTDEDIIFSVLKSLKTKDDLMYIIKDFGLRGYWLGTGANYLGQDRNLTEWFTNELSSSDLEKIKKEFIRLNVNIF